MSYQLLLSCDFCSLLDYGNLNNQTSFRLDYKFRLFKGYNQTINPYTGSKIVARNGVLHKTLPGSEKAYINSTKDYEAYRLVNLGFVYNHKKNTNYMINLPYLSNTDFYGYVIPSIGAAVSEKKQYTGFGDLNIGIQKIASKEYKQWKHTIKLGFLLFLPTGKYNEEELFSGNIHMLPGRSIYATELSANYTFENSGNWGLNWVSSYYIPFKKNEVRNSNDYQFAKRIGLDFIGFKIFEGKLKKIITLGAKYEYQDYEKINNYRIDDSGFQVMLANVGLAFKYKQNLCMMSLDVPLLQKLNGLQVYTKQAYSISLIHYLKKLKTEK